MEEQDGAELLAEGKAFVDLSYWRKVAVTGADAPTWLNDLVSNDVSDLGRGRARQALLLSPTGRIRAMFTVAVPSETILLIQDPSQRSPVDDVLSRYVLSSDVQLEDRTGELALFAFPGVISPPDEPGASVSAPSCLGVGLDLICPAADHDRLAATLAQSFRETGGEEMERWRVLAGRPLLGVDAVGEDLPVEAGLDDLVSYGKGCYLGQEAVAKVRNLGHPRRLVMALEASEMVSPGDAVLVDGSEAGQVTTVARIGGRVLAMARVGWEARTGPFRTATGTELKPRST
jgi:folate-binding protein YgfZ